jgi:hypothetical protein
VGVKGAKSERRRLRFHSTSANKAMALKTRSEVNERYGDISRAIRNEFPCQNQKSYYYPVIGIWGAAGRPSQLRYFSSLSDKPHF